jgi:uncharacterized protein (DUF2147 family)
MILLLNALFLLLQNPGGDDLLGYWEDADKESLIHIYKEDGKYCGKMIDVYNPYWESGEKKIDKYNPDPKLRERPFEGVILLLDLEWNGREFVNGRIYNPVNGKYYSCKGKMNGMNRLELRGYIGFSLFGANTTWTRKEN